MKTSINLTIQDRGIRSYFWYWGKKIECHFKNHIQIYPWANIFLGFMCNYLFVAWQIILSLANTPVMPQHLHRKITLFCWEILLSSKMPKCLEMMKTSSCAFRFIKILFMSFLDFHCYFSYQFINLSRALEYSTLVTLAQEFLWCGVFSMFEEFWTRKNKDMKIKPSYVFFLIGTMSFFALLSIDSYLKSD